MEIFSFCYNSISDGMSRRLNDLISSVWGNVEGKPLHLRELNAMSFCAADGAKVVGYAGVLAWPVSVEGRMFRMGALSCVHASFISEKRNREQGGEKRYEVDDGL